MLGELANHELQKIAELLFCEPARSALRLHPHAAERFATVPAVKFSEHEFVQVVSRPPAQRFAAEPQCVGVQSPEQGVLIVGPAALQDGLERAHADEPTDGVLPWQVDALLLD